jgi:hypothetical protein
MRAARFVVIVPEEFAVSEEQTATSLATQESTAPAAEPQANPQADAVDAIGFLRQVIAFFGAFLAMTVIGLVGFTRGDAITAAQKSLQLWALMIWGVVPPLALVAEYQFLWPHLKARGKCFTEFQHEQSLARNFWFGIAGVIAALLLHG